ncbi:MAG: hypothetical protein OEM67_11810, partial [Thermoleophilia bacterium]|nr:hypothetical protein [Thermoleophilia bacterium]
MVKDSVAPRAGPTGSSRPKRWEWLLASTILTLAAARLVPLVVTAWAHTTDDAYITLRYSRHLAQGMGLVWNVGETPVEG